MEDGVEHTIRLRAIELDDLPLLKKWRNELRYFFREYRLLTDANQLKWYNSCLLYTSPSPRDRS